MFDTEAMATIDVVGELIGLERSIAAAQAGQLRLIAELYARSPEWIDDPPPGCEGVDPLELAAAEVRAALSCSALVATNRVVFAVSAVQRLPRAVAELAAGRLSLTKLRILTEHTAPLDPEAVAVVEAAVLAGGREGEIPSVFGARVRRAVLRADPQAARDRVEQAVRQRCVEFWPGEDGMAVLRATLPAPEALSAYRALTAAAQEARAAEQTAAAERAEAEGTTGEAGEATEAAGAETAAAEAAGNDAAGSTVEDRDATGSAEGKCGDPEVRTLSQHRADLLTGLLLGLDPAHEATPGDAETADPTDPADPADAGRGRPRWPTGPTALHVTVPWTTVAGLSDQPGELTGYGPLDADTVRDLAADATWRRILTDPASGAVLDVGTTSYHPPAALAAFIRARDRTCRFPCCARSAARADLDHTVHYPHGPTAEDNLGALCRGDHRIKTLSRWRVIRLPDGGLEWTSPTGMTHRTDPPDLGGDASSAA